MKKSIVFVLLILSTLTGCSRSIPSRLQVEKRKTPQQRLRDAVREKERGLHRLRGTDRDDPTPR